MSTMQTQAAPRAEPALNSNNWSVFEAFVDRVQGIKRHISDVAIDPLRRQIETLRAGMEATISASRYSPLPADEHVIQSMKQKLARLEAAAAVSEAAREAEHAPSPLHKRQRQSLDEAAAAVVAAEEFGDVDSKRGPTVEGKYEDAKHPVATNFRCFVDEPAVLNYLEDLQSPVAFGGGGELPKATRELTGLQTTWEEIRDSLSFQENPYAYVALYRWAEGYYPTAPFTSPYSTARACERKSHVIDAISQAFTRAGSDLRRTPLPFNFTAMSRCLSDSWAHLSQRTLWEVRCEVMTILTAVGASTDLTSKIREVELRGPQGRGYWCAVFETLLAGLPERDRPAASSSSSSSSSPSSSFSSHPLAAPSSSSSYLSSAPLATGSGQVEGKGEVPRVTLPVSEEAESGEALPASSTPSSATCSAATSEADNSSRPPAKHKGSLFGVQATAEDIFAQLVGFMKAGWTLRPSSFDEKTRAIHFSLERAGGHPPLFFSLCVAP